MVSMIVNGLLGTFVMAAAFGLSWVLGRPTHSPAKDEAYESGIAPVGSAHIRSSVPYYLVAIFFLMFDVEIAFLYAWGVNLYELSWAGFAKALVFILFLAGGLAYIWLKGGLEWRRPLKAAPSSPSYSRN